MLSAGLIDEGIEHNSNHDSSKEETQFTDHVQSSFIARCSLWFHSHLAKLKQTFLFRIQGDEQDSTLGDDVSDNDASLNILLLPKAEFVMRRLLGKGSFSRVMLCEDLKNHKKSAIKLISIAELEGNQALKASVLKEIGIMKSIRHPHIVKFEKVVRTCDCIGIVMECCPEGDLFSLVSREGQLDEALVKDITRQLISAIKYLHSKGIAHRDVKLENILLETIGSSLRIKLADFGLARPFYTNAEEGSDSGQSSGVQMLHTRCGSEEYAAPEVIRGLSYDGRLTDAWSVGIVIYACLFGTLPFKLDHGDGNSFYEGSKKQLYNRICTGVFKVPKDIPISEKCRKALYALLRVNPDERMTLGELEKHQWLSQDQ